MTCLRISSTYLSHLCQHIYNANLVVDCMDPTCSGRGVCVQGECHCFVGWGGPGCESPRASCMDQCSGHGAFLADTGTCSCDPNWTGHDCSTGENNRKRVNIGRCSVNGSEHASAKTLKSFHRLNQLLLVSTVIDVVLASYE